MFVSSAKESLETPQKVDPHNFQHDGKVYYQNLKQNGGPHCTRALDKRE